MRAATLQLLMISAGVLWVCFGLTALLIERSVADAIIGESQLIERDKPHEESENSLTDLKAKYHRPETIPFPPRNPYTVAKAALGKKLFYDPRLSGSGVISCGTCHNPSFGWSDGKAKAVGHGMEPLNRRSPAIINLAWGEVFMWDGRFPTLEQQALAPIASEDEMNLPLPKIVKRLKSIEGYVELFEAAFPDEPITAENTAKALATYERTLVSGSAPFDAWIEGDDEAISPAAKRGFVLFNGKARCAECHSGWNFTDDSFHDIGLASRDPGRGKFLPNVEKMQHAFKTPGLRGVTERGPFMHDGSLATLKEVIDHYDEGGIDRPSKSDLMTPLGLTEQEKADLIAFLKTLSSQRDVAQLPTLPR